MEKTKRVETTKKKVFRRAEEIRAEEIKEAENKENEAPPEEGKVRTAGMYSDADSPGVTTPHDKGYKKSLSRPSEFLHFIKKYIRADWMMELKESDLILCDKEMLERDYEGKEADLLYRVSLPGGREAAVSLREQGSRGGGNPELGR